MRLRNIWRVLRKDLAMGPRSPLLLWALVLPAILTVVIRGVFGGLFDPEPRLGILDEGASAITTEAQTLDGIQVTVYQDRDTVLADVETNNLDAALILPPGFDDAVRAGAQPALMFFVGGESLASNRIILSVSTLELVREVAGTSAPVDVQIVSLGEAEVELSARLLPLIVVFAVAVSGVFVTAAALVQEKERRTLDAVLVSPVTVNEVLAAKAAFGFVLAILTGLIALALNSAFGRAPLAMVLSLVVGAVMMAEVGLLLGAWAGDANAMFTAWKSGGILLMYPVIFYIWPDLPSWIAQTGPTYYFLQPVFAIAVEGATLADVWLQLVIGAAICIALIPAVVWVGKWMERRLATGKLARVHVRDVEPVDPAAM